MYMELYKDGEVLRFCMSYPIVYIYNINLARIIPDIQLYT